MNSRFIHNGSCLHPDRFDAWKSLSPEGLPLSLFSHIEQKKEVELYLVKWRNLSYLHCSWETKEDMVSSEGPHIKQKLQVTPQRPCHP